MLLLLTIALVVIGAVALLIGFVNDQMFPIYLSIACSVGAAVVLLIFSRLSRTRLEPAARPAAATGGTAGSATAVLRTDAEPSFARGGGDGLFPIAEYDDLRVSEILPLLPELDLDELEQVREREESGRSRASILRRIDELADELESQTAVESPARGRGGDDLFPIEDYDDLRVSEILPLLDELEPDELEDVADRERGGAARASILGRIDDLLGRGAEPITIAAGRAGTATKAPAKKTAKKTGAAKKTTGAAKKTTGAAKKTAGSAKKTTGAAKKASAKKAGGTTKKTG